MGTESARLGPGRAAALAVGGCTLLVAMLVTWASAIGPGQVVAGDGPGRVTLSTSASSPILEGELGRELDPQDSRPQREAPLFVKVLLAILVAAPTLAVMLLLVLAVRRVLRLRMRRRESRSHVDFDVVATQGRAVTDEMVRGAEQQRHVLIGGSPRNAIVACWYGFETQAANAGVRPQPWETSSEFAGRVLGIAGADAAAVAALAAEFRAARFGTREVSEEARVRAVGLLDQIHASVANTSAEFLP